MSFNTTIDDVAFAKSTEPENIAKKMFVQKEWTNPIYDTNTSSNYASNQIIFDTTSLSTTEAYVNYQEGLIVLPAVIKLSCTQANGTAVDFSTDAYKWTDFVLGMKNSHTQILHSLSITLNNVDIVQNVPLTNAYLSFIQHSELSSDDEWLNGPLTGYAKDSSGSWYRNAPTKTGGGAWSQVDGSVSLTGDSRGVGLGNNCNFGLINPLDINESHNDGLLKRQRFVNKLTDEKRAVLGTLSKNKENCKSYVENLAAGKYIYYDIVLRLKDICPNLFNNLPMAMGLKFRITLTLNNNVSFRFIKKADGTFVYDPTTFANVTSQTNPLMVCASYNKFVSQTGGRFGASSANANEDLGANGTGNYVFKINDVDRNESLVPCGSSTLPVSDTNYYTVTMKLGKVDAQEHQRPQCILYVPSYRLNPTHEQLYAGPSVRIRKIHYTELEYQTFTAEPNTNFNRELSSSCLRPKRLIMIPIINSMSNFGLNPISSPFASEPATSSPCIVSSFNCQISNVNLFPNDINYDYDHFLQELNGQTGVNANLVNGLVSSRINLVDFQNNYHYIVCDLSRRTTAQDMTAVSIRVRGSIQSPLTIDFHCFIEREKTIEIDIFTGALINRY